MGFQKVFDEDAVAEARTLVKAAFQALRSKGIRARVNFMCCGTCATAAMDLKGKRGGVYWHNQAEESFREYGVLHVGFFTQSGDKSVEIGKDLSAALKRAGLDVEWSGSPDTKVTVYAAGARPKKGDK